MADDVNAYVTKIAMQLLKAMYVMETGASAEALWERMHPVTQREMQIKAVTLIRGLASVGLEIRNKRGGDWRG